MKQIHIDNKERFTKELYKLTNHLNAGKITYIQRLIYNKKNNYNIFYISKKNGRSRKIEAPLKNLKTLQRNILDLVLFPKWYDFIIHQSCKGFAKGKSIILNSSEHVCKKRILKVDLKSFFPSINFEAVKSVFLLKGLNDQCSRFLAEICTLEGHLPQGAPTSPIISNIICRNLDKRLFYLSQRSRLNYTRYADDLTFSGDKINKNFYLLVKKIVEDENFKINENKIYWFTNKRRQMVTGLIVNNKVSYGKKKYKALAAFVNNCANKENNLYEQKSKAITKYKLKISNLKYFLEGHISFLQSIDKQKGKKLRDVFNSISQSRWKEYELLEEKEDKKDIYISLCKIISEINNSFTTPLFKKSTEKLISFTQNFSNRGDFNNFCIAFGDYIDHLDTSVLGKKIDEDHRPIDNLTEWLNEKKYNGEEITESLKDIKRISNWLSRHQDNSKSSKIFNKYREPINNVDFNRLSIKLVKKIYSALIQIKTIFSKVDLN